MSTNIGNTYTGGVQSYAYQNTQSAKAAEEAKTTEQTTTAAKEDTFVKSKEYKPDMDKVNSMKADLNKNVSAFKAMVQGLFQKQGGIANSAMGLLLNIDKATQASAQQAISEDGEWGVNATATRILDFAKALSGGDPAKAETLRSAVLKGFEAAEKVWGGKLPAISYQTRDQVMKGFDEWISSSSAAATTAAV